MRKFKTLNKVEKSEILILARKGLTNQEIADRLGVTRSAIEKQIRSLREEGFVVTRLRGRRPLKLK